MNTAQKQPAPAPAGAISRTRLGSCLLGNRLPILAYHRIADEAADALAVPPAVFAIQMDWLHEHDIHVISLDEALRRVANKEGLRHSVLLTFDDGYTDVIDQVLPILARYNFTATISVVTGKLGGRSDWHRVSPPAQLLSLSDLRQIRNAGFEIGSHSFSHALLTELTLLKLEKELKQSKAFLEDNLGASCSVFVYPYGIFGPREHLAVIQAGYECACGLENFWANGYETDRFCLHRFEVRRQHTLADFRVLTNPTPLLPLTVWQERLRAKHASEATRRYISHPSQRRAALDQLTADDLSLEHIVMQLHVWLESMRVPAGYCGPVAHWWQNSMQFAGVGLDWRYEGIIQGYLNLHVRSGEAHWLSMARRAGDDLISGQLPGGNFRNSNFEINPYTAGTPHEAACDVGLLALAKALQRQKDSTWQIYAQAAECNLKEYLFGRLWNPRWQYFCDEAHDTLFVCNKAATILEALFAWKELAGEEQLLMEYGRPTLDALLERQVHAPGTQLDGAIDQSSYHRRNTGMYFPFYIARCIPALLNGFDWAGDNRYLEAARSAMAFIRRQQLPDGSFPQLLYRRGRIKYYPRWIAGTGDILRSMELMRQRGMDISLQPTLAWLLKGLLPSGGIRTAYGFASQGTQKTPPARPDFRDLLPVSGWVDKAFRYLTSCIQPGAKLEPVETTETTLDCLFRGHFAQYHEDNTVIEVWQERELAYRWRKGSAWADTLVFFG